MEGIASTIAIFYFLNPSQHPNSNYTYALVLNLVNIISHMFITIPFIIKLCKRKRNLSLNQEYSKFIALSNKAMPIFCGLTVGLSLFGICGLIGNLFQWVGYDYLFVNYCLIASSFTTAINFLKIRVDCIIVFSLQVYKFFLLIIGTIIFGIIGIESKVDTLAIGVGWLIFVFQAKKSLPKQALYYILMILEITFFLTACFMTVGYSETLTIKEYLAILFFVLLIVININDFKNFLKSYSHDLQFQRRKKSSAELYYGLANLKSNNEKKSQDPCSICLENTQDAEEQRIILECGHCFHIDCIYEWILINYCCPLCRKQLGLFEKDDGQSYY